MLSDAEPTTSAIWKLATVAALAILYARMFLFFYPSVGNGGAPFAALTVLVAGWFFGLRGGLITSVLVGAENLMLFRVAGGLGWMPILEHGNAAGLVALILVGGAIGHMSDLSRKVKGYTKLLRHEAFHDPLTRLPNRALFYDRLEHALARVTRGTNSIALLFLDLDGFKQINDRYGHVVGDQLLAAVAERLRSRLRAGDTIARLGGDEFVILLEDLVDLNAAEQAVERLIHQLTAPFLIEGVAISITASIGIAFRAAGAHRSEDLLLDADRAMYQAKTSGKARYQIFEPIQTRATHATIEPVAAMGD